MSKLCTDRPRRAQLIQKARYLSLATACVLLWACGGGGGNGNSSGGSSAAPGITHLAPLQAGQHATLSAGSDIYVPAGTSVLSPPNGSTITINGANNSINVLAGSQVIAPANATGPANNLVSVAAVASITPIESVNVSVLAGDNLATGAPTADGLGTQAVFWGGGRLAIDPTSGNIIATDRGELREVTPGGQVTTHANAGLTPAADGVAIDANGNIFVTGDNLTAAPTMWSAYAQELSAASIVTTLNASFATSATDSSIGFGGLAIDTAGNLYFADGVDNLIWKISSTGAASHFAGSGAAGEADGIGNAASFNNPKDIAIDRAGNLYVIDTGNNAIRKITPSGEVTTFASNFPDSLAAITIDPVGNMYVATLTTIFRMSATGVSTVVTPIANFVSGLVADGSGNIYAAYRGQKAGILKISL